MGNAVKDTGAVVLGHVRDFAHRQVESWAERCAEFRRWEAAELLDKEPSEKTLAQHRNILRIMLKATESMLSNASEPEVFDIKLHDRLTLIQARLKDSWTMFHEPMSTEEADGV